MWWLRGKTGGCKQCREDHRFLGLGPPPCDACDPPPLAPGNQPAWDLVAACDLALTDGMGGLNLANVRQVAEALNLVWDEALIRKVTIIARYHLGENLKDLMDGEEVGD